MKIENTYKDWFASLLGSVAMVYAGYSWHLDDLTDSQAGSVAFIGFVLLFLRTTLTRVIGDGLSKVFDAVMGKIFGKGGPPAAIFLFMLVSFTASGQFYNMEEARLVDNKPDSTIISGVGQMRWDAVTKKFRFGNGTSWLSFRSAADPIVSTIGAINGGTEHANGASISGSTLYMQTADATYPGLVSTGPQSFAGNKTFTGIVDLITGNSSMLKFNRTGVTTSYGFEQDATSIGLYDYVNTRYRIRADGNNVLLNETSGNVGIGIDAPADALHIKKAVSAAYTGGVIDGGFQINSGWSGASEGNYGHNGITFYGDLNTASFIYQIHDNAASSHLVLGTNNLERVRITTSGNVGIGTTSPNAPLHFAAIDYGINRKLVLHEAANNEHQFYGFGVNLNTLRYQVWDATTSHVWYAGTSTTTSTELMRLTGTGKLGIGNTPSYNLDVGDGANYSGIRINSGTSAELILENDIFQWSMYAPIGTQQLRLYSGGSDRFTFASDGIGTATDWVATSDRRLKKDIKYVDSQLEKVNAISRHVVNYNRTDNGRNETGFVAQELYEVAPEYVNKPENDTTMWSVNYSKMVVPLYKAIEELTAEVNKLKQELNELKK